MTQPNLTKTLLEVLLSPYPQKKYAWVSEVEEGTYHVETHASAAQGGQTFRALCGATGDFNCYLQARQIMPRHKCATCQQLSTSGILDVGSASEAGSMPASAVKQNRPNSGRGCDGNSSAAIEVAVTAGDYSSATKGQCADSGTGGGAPLQVPPLERPYLTAAEIVDKVEQMRLEEIEAEREGAAMEASVYADPAGSRY